MRYHSGFRCSPVPFERDIIGIGERAAFQRFVRELKRKNFRKIKWAQWIRFKGIGRLTIPRKQLRKFKPRKFIEHNS